MDQTLNVVVLAAGRGERFAAAGVTVPKPLIEFRGWSLLRRSVDLARELRQGSGRVIVVATPVVAVHARALDGVDHVVEASVTQRGPVGSGLLAMAHLPTDQSVVFMDCDNYYPGEARSWVSEVPVGSNFLALADVPPGQRAEAFCNVRLNDLGMVVYLAEKMPLGGPRVKVATGVYGFATAQEFQRIAGELIFTMAGELAMSQAVARAGLGPLGRGLYGVPVEAWHPIGTPEQLQGAAEHGPQSPTTSE